MTRSADDTYPPPPEGDDLESIEIELHPVEIELIGDDGAPVPQTPEPAQSLPAPPRPNLLIIEADDLDDAPQSVYPGLPGAGYPSVDGLSGAKGKKGALAQQLVGSLVMQLMVAGAIGGFMAWAVQEPGMRAHALQASNSLQTPFAQLIYTCKFGAIMAAFISLCLGATEGVVLGNWRRAATGGAMAFGIGLCGGAIGGIVGQTVFRLLLGGAGTELSFSYVVQTIAARSIGWAAVGAFVGMAPGAIAMAPRKITNGVIGGAAGGFIGGLLFDAIDLALQAMLGPAGGQATSAIAGTPSRLVGITTLGLCTGLGIGLVEELRKEAWLQVTGGPLMGKQFVLYNTKTVIGSAPTADIALVKDRAVTDDHCTLEAVGAAHILRCSEGKVASVNGRQVHSQRLTDGDLIGVGHTELQYRVRPIDFEHQPSGM